jgi:AcrR family transcriptional regulator
MVQDGTQVMANGTEAHRAPWGSLSRSQIIDTATRIVTEDGFAALTIRHIAADLGVAPMSRYRHGRDKDDLLDDVVDRLVERNWRPQGDPTRWREWVIEAAQNLRELLVSEPAVLSVYLRHPVVSAAATQRMDAVLDVLERVAGTRASALDAYATIHTFTVGFAALEASRSAWIPRDDGVVSRDLERQLAGFTSSERFSTGLSVLLDGLEHRFSALG